MDERGVSGIAELLAALRTEADEERAESDRQTRERTRAIGDAARAEVAILEQEALLAQEPALEAEVRRRLAAARVDAARAMRSAFEASCQEAFGALRTRLEGLRGEDRYPRVFAALLDEALAALPTATRLLVDPRDERLAREAAPGLRVEAALETSGGVVAVDDDGRVARNTLEERMANAEPALRLALGQVAREMEDR